MGLKITITPPVSGAQPFLLSDNSARVLSGTLFPNGAGGALRDGFIVEQERETQTVAPIRAPYKIVLPRYNLSTAGQFLVERSFASTNACVGFIAQHPSLVPATGLLTLVYSVEGGLIKLYLATAVIKAVRCVKHTGQYCEFHYQYAGSGSGWSVTSP